MKNLFLSIIIPVYNAENYISRCLDSILTSVTEITNFEIILVNDGSTDKSQCIIDSYQQRFPLIIKSFIQENQGIGPTRNTGLLHASGEYIWFVDNDDCIAPNCISYLEKVLHDTEIDILDISFTHSFYPKNPLKQISTDNKKRPINLSQKEAFYLKKDYPWSKVYNRDFLNNQIPLFPNIYGEDTATIYRLYAETKNIYEININLYAWYDRKDSFSNIITTKKHFETYPKLISILLQQSNKYTHLKEEFEYIILSKNKIIYKPLYTRQCPNELLNIKNASQKQVDDLLKIINKENFYIKLDELIVSKENDRSKIYENSFSWKITKPIRFIIRIVKGLRINK